MKTIRWFQLSAAISEKRGYNGPQMLFNTICVVVMQQRRSLNCTILNILSSVTWRVRQAKDAKDWVRRVMDEKKMQNRASV